MNEPMAEVVNHSDPEDFKASWGKVAELLISMRASADRIVEIRPVMAEKYLFKKIVEDIEYFTLFAQRKVAARTAWETRREGRKSDPERAADYIREWMKDKEAGTLTPPNVEIRSALDMGDHGPAEAKRNFGTEGLLKKNPAGKWIIA